MRRSWILFGASLILVSIALANRFFWSPNSRNLSTYLPSSTVASFRLPRPLIVQDSYPILEGHPAVQAAAQRFRDSWLSSEQLLGNRLEEALYLVTDDGTGVVPQVMLRFSRKLSDEEVMTVPTAPLVSPSWFLEEDVREVTRLTKKIVVVSSRSYAANYYQRDAPIKTFQPFEHHISFFLKKEATGAATQRIPPVFVPLLTALAHESDDSLSTVTLSPQFMRLHTEYAATETVAVMPLSPLDFPEDTDMLILAPLAEISTAEYGVPGVSGLLDEMIEKLSSHYGVVTTTVRDEILPLSLFFSKGDAWMFGGNQADVMHFSRSMTSSFDVVHSETILPDGSPFVEMVSHSPDPHEELVAGVPVKAWYRDDLGSVYALEAGENSLASNSRELLEEALVKQQAASRADVSHGQYPPLLRLSCKIDFKEKDIIRLILAKDIFLNQKSDKKSLAFAKSSGENNKAYLDYCLTF